MILFEEEQLKKNLHPDLFNLIKTQLTPIELPSAEDIANKAEILFTLEEQESFIDGAKWMKEQIKNQIK